MSMLSMTAKPMKRPVINALRLCRFSTDESGTDHYHTVANPAKGKKPGERGAGQPKTKGYRPSRTSQSRRQRPGRG